MQAEIKTDSQIPLMESFYTIQGEGLHQGKAAYFIRLAGCDVGCHWCDVKESWDESAHPTISIQSIVEEASKHPARLAVITGGEPLMHNLDELTQGLRNKGFKTHIETSGAHPLSGEWDWITFSPKKFKKPLPEVARGANELKVIVYNKSDFEWAKSFQDQVSDECRKFLQPEWSKSKDVIQSITEFVMENPSWEISLQTHKYMNIP